MDNCIVAMLLAEKGIISPRYWMITKDEDEYKFNSIKNNL